MDRNEINISPAEFAQANRLGREMRSNTPRAVSARFNRRMERVVIHLSTGIDLAFPPQIAQGLENATSAQLSEIEISPSGFGIHFPRLDADIYLPALLEGFLGSRQWMASRLGAQGGKSTSPAKAAAAKRNGRSGGRPRKRAPAVA
jgi:hypothetical protein